MDEYRKRGENLRCIIINSDFQGAPELFKDLGDLYRKTDDPSGELGEYLIGLGVVEEHEV